MKTQQQHTSSAIWMAVFGLFTLLFSLPTHSANLPLTRYEQRFFPRLTLKVVGVDTTTDEVIVRSPFGRGADGTDFVDFALISDADGNSGLTRIYGGAGIINDDSADTSLLYGVRFTSNTRCRIYPDFAAARNGGGDYIDLSADDSEPDVRLATSNWCWNACSQMTLNYYGTSTTQDQIADNAMTTIPTTSGRYQNVPNFLDDDTYFSVGSVLFKDGIGRILRKEGEVRSKLYGPLSQTEFENEIDGSRPLILAVSGAAIGHVFVAHGYIGDTLAIADPWPSNDATAYSFAALQSTGYSGSPWVASLATGDSLDVVFLIDSTGSMGDDIAAVRSQANSIINNISNQFTNFRIAVMDYRDDPGHTGNSGDYRFQVRTGFTNNTSTVANAINGITASGGGDIPESVYSALYTALDGTAIGGWRPGSTARVVIIMADAPGHDPEPFSGGRTFAECRALALDDELPIRVTGVIVGGSAPALAMSDLLAGATGGVSINAAGAINVPSAINSAIDELASSLRFPRGEVAAIRPTFTAPGSNPKGMLAPAKSRFLHLEREVREKWRTQRMVRFLDDSEVLRFPRNLPIGTYRWRTSQRFAPQSLLSPSGTAMFAQKSNRTIDADYTEFERLEALPGMPGLVSPNPLSFTAEDKRVTFTWNAGINATAYVIEVFSNSRRIKRVTVKVPGEDVLAPTLSVELGGFKPGENYSWRMQSLNYDRRKIDGFEWAQ